MLAPGQIVGGTYQVLRLLGRGGMAEVYLVEHTRLPRRFALKVLRLDHFFHGPTLARFAREAEILARLRHPHIVDIVDWNHTQDGEPYLVMELLEGEDLARFLRKRGALPQAQALAIATQIGSALAAAHQAAVVHRDLKPSNIFLVAGGPFPHFVKVLDFGIARLVLPGGKPLTASEEVLGTPGYMAPEQARGRLEEVDYRADQFALAAILYELLSGQPAFYRPGERVEVTLDRILNADLAPLSPAIASRELCTALERALRKRPTERYATIEAFLSAATASAVLASTPASSPSLPALGQLPWTEVAQRRFLLSAVLLTAVLVLAVWAWLAGS